LAGPGEEVIDDIGPCVERGYYRIAMMGREVPDVTELEAGAEGRSESSQGLSRYQPRSTALADSGLALISLWPHC